MSGLSDTTVNDAPPPPEGTGPGGSGGSGDSAGRPWWRSPWLIGALVVLIVAVGATAGLFAVSSSGHKTVVVRKTTTHQHAKKVAAGPTCPLTGTAPTSGPVPHRPALAIKVDNYPAARPQSGLDQADVVFEEPVEGGVTRYVAVFQCQESPLVGPIRSARYPDVGILDLLNDPIFVHVGGIDPIQAMIKAADDDDYDLFYNGSIVQHPSGREAPYDTYVSTAAAWKANTSDSSMPAPLFTYSSLAPSGVPVAGVHIPFSDTSDERWTWNANSREWMLSYSGAADVGNDGVPVGATNVVILHVVTSTGPWEENDLGAYEVEVTPTGTGQLQVLRDGELVSGTWSRSSLSGPYHLLSSSGSPLALSPGTTWVDLVPDSISVTSS